MLKPKFSILTVSFNNVKTISDTINSVLSQTYQEIEYIIIDNSSTDGTIELVQSFGKEISKFISETDKGIYDAINKGIRLASGDIVGIINSDDFFCNADVIQKVADAFSDTDVDAVFGDAQFV